MSNKTPNILNFIVKRIIQYLENNVDKIVLFGSYARNTQKDDSDVDIIVFMNQSPGKIKKFESGIIDLIMEFLEKYEKYFSIILDSTKNYNKYLKYSPFYNNIKEEGIIIYERGSKINIKIPA
jgi:predicted nucleotidyltransferase